MTIETLHDMFLHTLKDLHYAEKRILKALPAMITAANNAELKDALTAHMAETKGQITRLGEVFAILKAKPGTEVCDAIDGILKEADGIIEDTENTMMRDSAVIASGQAVEHYEIVRYRSLVMWSGTLGLDDATLLLQQSLDEECAADEKLLALGAYCQTDEAKPKAA
jgi:ferritin-like metal-binding protein YciE